MNLAPLGGVIAGAAGAPLAQSKGTDVERAQHHTATHSRQAQSAERADNAAGIAATDGEEHQPQERDADGRRMWEEPPGTPTHPAATIPGETDAAAPAPPSRDASGERGLQLDLSG